MVCILSHTSVEGINIARKNDNAIKALIEFVDMKDLLNQGNDSQENNKKDTEKEKK